MHMTDRLPLISDVHFEQSPERLKIVIPTRRYPPMQITYSLLMLTWLVMLVWGLIFTVQTFFSGERYAIVFGIMLLVFLYVLYRFGRFMYRQWAYFMSNREILFINNEELIVRRPLSIWGLTDVYGMEHVSPFYGSHKPRALAFDYGYRHVYFAEALTPPARRELRRFLNARYFPGRDAEDSPDDAEQAE